MADKKKSDRFKGLVSSLLSPGVPKAEGATMPLKYMENRKAKLDSLEKKSTGGMFDFIYKKRKEREKTLKEAGY